MRAADVLRRIARRAVPLELRQSLAHRRRTRRDRAEGASFHCARGGDEWPVAVALWQPVMPSEVLEAKLSNLRRGAALIDRGMIEPRGTWSFWSEVGRPSARNGFREGRNLVDGRLVRQVGGGLCQLSGLVHHLALLAGLEVVERHAHSIDIYREEERHTPLGADATVVWGFKDLRLCNPHRFAVSIGCAVDGQRLVGEIRGGGPIAPRTVTFVREPVSPRQVRVVTEIEGRAVGATEYERRPELALG